MHTRSLLLAVPLSLMLGACPEPEPDPVIDPEPIALPDTIPTEWLEGISGTIENLRPGSTSSRRTDA